MNLDFMRINGLNDIGVNQKKQLESKWKYNRNSLNESQFSLIHKGFWLFVFVSSVKWCHFGALWYAKANVVELVKMTERCLNLPLKGDIGHTSDQGVMLHQDKCQEAFVQEKCTCEAGLRERKY
jgi:hypothetical protein